MIELPAHLLELLADLHDDRLEAAFEVVDGASGMGLRLLAELLDLGQRLLRLARRVAAERRGHLFGARLGLGEGAFDDARVVAHHAVEFLRLGVDRVQQGDDGLMAALEDRVDLGVRGVERLGRGEDRLALVLEALGQAMDLLEQPLRHLAQVPGLAGEDVHRLLGLSADLLGRLAHHLRVVGEHLVELRRLAAEGLRRHAGMLAEHLVGLGRALPEGDVDGLKPLGQRRDHELRALAHGLVERRGLLGDGRLQPLRLLEQRLGEEVGPLGQGLVEGDGALIDRRGELSRAVGQGLVYRAGPVLDRRGEGVGALLQRLLEGDDALRHHAGKGIGAILQGLFDGVGDGTLRATTLVKACVRS